MSLNPDRNIHHRNLCSAFCPAEGFEFCPAVYLYVAKIQSSGMLGERVGLSLCVSFSFDFSVWAHCITVQNVGVQNRLLVQLTPFCRDQGHGGQPHCV